MTRALVTSALLLLSNLVVAACGRGSSPPASPALAPIVLDAPASTTAMARACPLEPPLLDSECQGFAAGTSCIYAEGALGCSCSTTSASERTAERPWSRVWRCGEHGE